MLEASNTAGLKMANSLLPIHGTGLSITRAERRILDCPEMTVTGDGTLVILGHNGAGKSLLLKALAGLIVPDEGCVTWAGRLPDRTRALKLGFVLQRPVLLRRSALANVMYPLAVAGVGSRDQRSRALRSLREARLESLAGLPARVLSGGEQRRLAIARALVCEPEVLFLDEPSANLDPAATLSVEAQIRSAREAGCPVVLVTHDLGQARRLADEVVLMARGRVVEQAAATHFFKAPQSAEAKAFLAGNIIA
jgi:tungstate transport system ATP-binding protein